MASSIAAAIQQLIVERLMLPIQPEQIAVDAPLFGSSTSGGLGLDSLSSLELIAAISEKYDLPLDDVGPSDLQNIASITEYLKRNGVEETNVD